MTRPLKKMFPLLKTLIVLVLFFVLSQIMSQSFTRLFGFPPSTDADNPQVILFSILYFVIVVLLTFAATVLIDRRKITDIGLNMGAKEVILSLVALLILAGGFFIFIYLLQESGIAIWRWNHISPLTVLGAVIIYTTVGINEEFFFRGYLFKSLSVYGKVAGYIGSVLVFTLIHFLSQEISVLYLTMLVLISIFYILLLDITGSIWPGVIIHAGYDLILALTGGNQEKGSLIRWLYLDSGMTLNDLTMFLSIGLILLITLLVFILYKGEYRLITQDQQTDEA